MRTTIRLRATWTAAGLLTAAAASLGVLACSGTEADGGGTTGASGVDGGVSPSGDGGATDESDAAGPPPDAAAAGVTLVAVADLPRIALTRALSATVYDEGTRTLFALSDRLAHVVPLTASDDYTRFSPAGTPLALTGRLDVTWDGEGLARVGDDLFAVTVETTPTVERFGPNGDRIAAVPVPARFALANQGPGNKGLESLTVSPSGRFLFFANESALATDGPPATKTAGTTVRILRRELATSTDIELAYRTEPLGAGTGGGDMGVSELCALSDDVLLVLERGYQSGYGNTVRLFRVDVSTGTDVSGGALGASVLAKELVVDFATLPATGVTHPSTQPNAILDNYEALALGPRQPDGRRLLFVTSDDNESDAQVARVLTLAIPAP